MSGFLNGMGAAWIAVNRSQRWEASQMLTNYRNDEVESEQTLSSKWGGKYDLNFTQAKVLQIGRSELLWKISFTALEDSVGERLSSHNLSPDRLSFTSSIPGKRAPFLLKPHPGNVLGVVLNTWGCSSASAGQLLHTQEVWRRHRELLTPPGDEELTLNFPFFRLLCDASQ